MVAEAPASRGTDNIQFGLSPKKTEDLCVACLRATGVVVVGGGVHVTSCGLCLWRCRGGRCPRPGRWFFCQWASSSLLGSAAGRSRSSVRADPLTPSLAMGDDAFDGGRRGARQWSAGSSRAAGPGRAGDATTGRNRSASSGRQAHELTVVLGTFRSWCVMLCGLLLLLLLLLATACCCWCGCGCGCGWYCGRSWWCC